jgi:hypothetical protein
LFDDIHSSEDPCKAEDLKNSKIEVQNNEENVVINTAQP